MILGAGLGRSAFRLAPIALVFSCSFVPHASAQAAGVAVHGTVVDAQGAVLPGVT